MRVGTAGGGGGRRLGGDVLAGKALNTDARRIFGEGDDSSSDDGLRDDYQLWVQRLGTIEGRVVTTGMAYG